MATGGQEAVFVKLLLSIAAKSTTIKHHLDILQPFVRDCLNHPIFKTWTLFQDAVQTNETGDIIHGMCVQFIILKKYFELTNPGTEFVIDTDDSLQGTVLEPDIDGILLPQIFWHDAISVLVPPHKTKLWFTGYVPISECTWKMGISRLEVVTF